MRKEIKDISTPLALLLFSSLQWVPQLFEQLEFLHVNKSSKFECGGNKMHQITPNVMLSRGLEFKLNLPERTTISVQHP